MSKRIQSPDQARALVDEFELQGSTELVLDEVVSPVTIVGDSSPRATPPIVKRFTWSVFQGGGAGVYSQVSLMGAPGIVTKLTRIYGRASPNVGFNPPHIWFRLGLTGHIAGAVVTDYDVRDPRALGINTQRPGSSVQTGANASLPAGVISRVPIIYAINNDGWFDFRCNIILDRFPGTADPIATSGLVLQGDQADVRLDLCLDVEEFAKTKPSP